MELVLALAMVFVGATIVFAGAATATAIEGLGKTLKKLKKDSQ